VGSYSIKALAVKQKTDSKVLEVLGFIEIPSFGVRKGVVVDIDKVSKNIAEALNQLQENISQKIESVHINIGGSHIFSTSSRGTVIVSKADRSISQEDVSRVIQAAGAISLPSNNEILEVFPKEFIIDGHGQIKMPCDMQGLKLEVEVVALCAFSPHKQNLTSAVLNADFQISDIITSSLASSRAVLTPQQKELGVCLLDIGSGTTDLSVFQEGDLVHTAVFPIGSGHITNDLAVGLKVEVELAEQIKREFGACLAQKGGKKERVETESGEILVFSHKMLAGVIKARVSDIFDLTREELKKILSPSMLLQLPAGIVLTGGGAKLPRIIDLAKKELKLPAKIGVQQELDGLEKDPSLSAVCGLVLEACETSRSHIISLNSSSRFFTWLKKIFKVFLPS